MDKNFFEALMKGLEKNRSNYDKSKLEKLVKSNDPNDKETLNSTVIDILESDDTTALEVLLANQGIDVNAKDYDGKTCLSMAASAGSIKIVKLLLDRMKAADVRKYNKEGLLRLEFPKILPDLWLVEEVIAIVNLLTEKKINLTLQHKLAVLEFLVHNIDDCDCGNSEVNTRDLQKRSISDLITYGSAVHVSKIISKLREDIATKKIKLDNLVLIDYVGRSLSPGALFDLYIDEGIKKVVDDIECGWENYFPFKLHHDHEYKCMKAHKLQKNNRLSLHDVLAKNPRDTYHHVCKLDFHKLSKKYTCAGDYMKGLKAKSLIRHQVEEFLPEFMRALFPPLPFSCFEKVLYYIRELGNEDILSMCQVAVAKKKECKTLEYTL